MIPLRTALDKVSISSSASLFLIPAVLMLARIASARNGERIASVTTDAKFFVVLAFIGFVCPTVNAMLVCLATRMTFTKGVPVVQ